MTSVNSPACLLARNRFYRNLSPSPEQMKPVLSCQNNPITTHKQRLITLCVTVATPSGLSLNIVLGSAPHLPTSKPTSPADRGVK